MSGRLNESDIQNKREFKEEALIHKTSLMRTAIKITRSNESARDLVQETYFRAYKYWHRLKRNTNCRAWLYKIMMNIFINDYRAKKRRPTTINSTEITDNIVPVKYTGSYRLSPDDDLNDKIISKDIQEAIEEMPQKYRMIVVLAIIDRYSYREIQKITGLHPGTVKSRLARGRRMLQESLKDYARERGFAKAIPALQPSYA